VTLLAFVVGFLGGVLAIAVPVAVERRDRVRRAARWAPKAADWNEIRRMEHELFMHAWDPECAQCNLHSALIWMNAEDWRDLVVRHRETREREARGRGLLP